MFRLLVDRKYDLARYWSNRVLREIAPHFHGDAANVSGWEDKDKQGSQYREYFRNVSTYTVTNYPGYRGVTGADGEIELDLTATLPQSLRRRFDVVFNHTTLEHIFEVRKAFANLCDMTRDAVIVVVPFCQVQHESESFGDYWRLTPTCLRALFAENGLEVVYESESQDKDAAIYLLFAASRHPERYADKLPGGQKIKIAGRWIGASWLVSVYQFLANKIRKITSGDWSH